LAINYVVYLCATLKVTTMITLRRLEEAVDIRRQMDVLEKRLAEILETSILGVRGQEGRKRMSPSARAKISAAAKLRWAKMRGAGITTSKKTNKSGLTPAGRRRLSRLMKARWAAKRKAASKQ
jgi:hypothetical protein